MQMKKNIIKLNTGNNNNEEYKVEIICENTVYVKKLAGHLSKLYYLIFWKSYLKEENTQEFILAI